MAEEVSKRYALNKTEQSKMWTSLGLSLGGFILIQVILTILKVDLGAFNQLAASLAPFAINAIRLWLRERGIEPLAGKEKNE